MAFVVFSCILLLSIAISLLARRNVIKNNMNDIMVASGSFGIFLLFFISVGEIYTIGTLIGAPGSIYSRGADYGVWFISYILLAYVVGYFLNPAVWKIGRLSKAVTICDILGWRFNSKGVQLLLAGIAILFSIPYVQGQIAGLAMVLKYLNIGIGFGPTVIISAVIAFIYIAAAGIRASAYVSILKDATLIIAVIIVGVAAAMAMRGGVGGLFHAVAEKMPKLLTVTTKPITGGATFTLSTVAFQMLGFYLFANNVQATLSSKSAKNLRRNAILMPLYMLMFPFLVITAYFALLTIPGLKLADYALLAVVVKLLPSWLVGLVAGGAALTAILSMAVNGLTVGGLFSKNILGVIKPHLGQATMAWWTQLVTGLFLFVGVIMAFCYPTLLASIINIVYSGATQTCRIYVCVFLEKSHEVGRYGRFISGRGNVIMCNDFSIRTQQGPYSANR